MITGEHQIYIYTKVCICGNTILDQHFDNEADKHEVPGTCIVCPGPPTTPHFSLTLKKKSKFKILQTNQDIVFHFAIF